jgi:Zn ribbon nucleic-acid-binding protein
MHLICPECKNAVDLSEYSEIVVGQIIECNMCGISLSVEKIEGDEIMAEIVDEGK